MCEHVLKKAIIVVENSPASKREETPTALNRREVVKFLVDNLKHNALLMVIYSAGLQGIKVGLLWPVYLYSVVYAVT